MANTSHKNNGPVRSSVTPDQSFVIKARPLSKEEQAERDRIDQTWIESTKRRMEEMHNRAQGRKIVRKTNFYGSCVERGFLIKETPKFYVYAEGVYQEDGDIIELPQKRVLKSNAHVEPCVRCEDHPNTLYPMGSLD